MIYPKNGRLRPSLGKKTYTVYRDDPTGGYYEDGMWVDATKIEVKVKANIQPAFQAWQTRLLPEGDREKEAIFISSNHYIYTSRSSSGNSVSKRNLEPDYVLYNDCLWEVKYTMPYQNLGYHVECIAIKMPDSVKERVTGEVYGRV